MCARSRRHRRTRGGVPGSATKLALSLTPLTRQVGTNGVQYHLLIRTNFYVAGAVANASSEVADTHPNLLDWAAGSASMDGNPGRSIETAPNDMQTWTMDASGAPMMMGAGAGIMDTEAVSSGLKAAARMAKSAGLSTLGAAKQAGAGAAQKLEERGLVGEALRKWQQSSACVELHSLVE